MAAGSLAADAASSVLELSKAAWTLGISLSRLEQDTKVVDTTVRNLVGEVKSLGNESDLLYAELGRTLAKNETNLSRGDVDDGIWSCLEAQVEETNRTMQELELFVTRVRGEESRFLGQAQRQRKLDKSKDQIAHIRARVYRDSNNLRVARLLINL